MPPDLTGNPVANDVIASLDGQPDAHRGAVALRGFLHHPEGADPDVVRMYTDETYTTWYEIPAGDILARVAGGGTHLYFSMDLVWVKRETPVKRVHNDEACYFAETYEVQMAEDPAAGPRGKSGG